MKIIEHGRVVFQNGAIVEITGFHVTEGNADSLQEYVAANYKFLGTLPAEEKENDEKPVR
jgi:hypothetical protein